MQQSLFTEKGMRDGDEPRAGEGNLHRVFHDSEELT